jgi:hypothetical protein
MYNIAFQKFEWFYNFMADNVRYIYPYIFMDVINNWNFIIIPYVCVYTFTYIIYLP